MKFFLMSIWTLLIAACDSSSSKPEVSTGADQMIGNWYYYPEERKTEEFSDRLVFEAGNNIIFQIDYQEGSALWYGKYEIEGTIDSGSIAIEIDSIVDNLVNCDESISEYSQYRATCSTETRSSDFEMTIEIDTYQNNMLIYTLKEEPGKMDTLYRY